jgi:hypothetical protein
MKVQETAIPGNAGGSSVPGLFPGIWDEIRPKNIGAMGLLLAADP